MVLGQGGLLSLLQYNGISIALCGTGVTRAAAVDGCVNGASFEPGRIPSEEEGKWKRRTMLSSL